MYERTIATTQSIGAGATAARLPETTVSAAPFISVIVPVRNEAAFIARHLAATPRPSTTRRIASRSSSPTAARPTTTRTIVAALQPRSCQPAAARQSAALVERRPQRRRAGVARRLIVLLVDGHCEIDNPSLSAEPRRRLRAQRCRLPGPAATARRDRARRRCSGPSPRRVPRGSGHHPASHIYSRARRLRAAAERGRRLPPRGVRDASACSTNRSTPARTWSSTTAWRGPVCAVSSRRACGSVTIRALAWPACFAR